MVCKTSNFRQGYELATRLLEYADMLCTKLRNNPGNREEFHNPKNGQMNKGFYKVMTLS